MSAAHRFFQALEPSKPEEFPLEKRERFKRFRVTVDFSVLPPEFLFDSISDVDHFKILVHFTDKAAELKPGKKMESDIGKLLDPARPL